MSDFAATGMGRGEISLPEPLRSFGLRW